MKTFSPTLRSHSPLLQSSIQWTLAFAVSLGFLTMGILISSIKPTHLSENERGEGTKLLCLDLNQAADYELSLLPTVGPVLARRIVGDRQANGPFRSVDDLRRVTGIGPKTIAEISEYCCVDADLSPLSLAATQP
ncbi:ComE operon protein 1 [Novipirellula galeiformis]|uniref:ComE operon protein 1 n=1 Tax=Novipirellula galeiformis TaxID=2528004 RepID=A0A5C6CQM9_9BACT|nr:helix-hairpin-helix domain-containing protein [Novipirellula galeiformis]TWU26628.1 ComE operon protein 1 [Novipirellula galeiformis]